MKSKKQLDREQQLQTDLMRAYNEECERKAQWRSLALSNEHKLNLAVIERDEARLAIKVVVLGIVTCMLGLMFIMVHYGVK